MNSELKESVQTLRRLLEATTHAALLLEQHQGISEEIVALEDRREDLRGDIEAESARLARVQQDYQREFAEWEQKISEAKEKSNAKLEKAQAEVNDIMTAAWLARDDVAEETKLLETERNKLQREIEEKDGQLEKIRKQLRDAGSSMQAALSNVGSI